MSVIMELLKQQQQVLSHLITEKKDKKNTFKRLGIKFRLETYAGERRESLSAWVRQTRNQLESYRVPPQDHVAVAREYLRGTARQWYDANQDELETMDFPSFEDKLRERFLPQHEGVTQFRRLYQERQGQTKLGDFNKKFLESVEILRDVKLTIEQVLVGVYLSNCDTSIQPFLRAEWNEDMTVEDILKLADAYVDADVTRSKVREVRGYNLPAKKEDKPRPPLRIGGCPLHPNGRHTANECLGIKSKRDKPSQINAMQDVPSSKMSLQIPIIINGKEFHALLDSGATQDYISARVTAEAAIGNDTDKEAKEIQFANGEKGLAEWTKTFRCSIQAKPRRFTWRAKMLVTPHISHDVILGMTFLTRFNPNIDWLRGKIRIGVIDIPAELTPALPDSSIIYLRAVTTEVYSSGDVLLPNAKPLQQQIQKEFQDVFTKRLEKLPPKRDVDVSLDTGDAKPVYKSPHRLSTEEKRNCTTK